MEFIFENWSIRELYDKYESGNLDLNPPYQRNEIWSSGLKRELIDSIEREYPLPAFFVYERSDDKFELVDGQQRSRAIFGYIKKSLFRFTKNFL